MSDKSKYTFYSSCVQWPADDVDSAGGLVETIDNAIDISRDTLIKHIDTEQLKEMEINMGYAKNKKHGLTMKDDRHVSYHRSTLHGKRVYFFKHSAIEYFFTK